MTLYSIGVFLHVVGTLGLFTALGAEWLILSNLSRSTQATEARAWIRLLAVLPALTLSSIAAILLTGIYLAATAGGWSFAWIRVSLGAMVLIGFLGAVAGVRLRALRQTATHDCAASLDAYQISAADPALQTPIRTRLASALAVVMLMIARPDMSTSLLITGIAIAAGLLWSAPTWGPRRDQRGPLEER